MNKNYKFRGGFSGGRTGGSAFPKRKKNTPIMFPIPIPFSKRKAYFGLGRLPSNNMGYNNTQMIFPGANKKTFTKSINKPAINSISGEITKSSYVSGVRDPAWYRAMFKQAQKYTFNSINSGQTPSSTGRQFMGEYMYLKAEDIGLMSQDIVAQYPGGTYPSTTAKFGIQSCRSVLTFSNSGNNNLIFEIYELDYRFDQLVKSDTTQLPLYGAVNCMTNTWAFQKPLSSSTALANTSYQVTPFENAAFNQAYKVAKIQKVTLAPGSSHEHVSEYNINQTFNNIITSTYTGGAWRGITKSILVVQYGLPVHSTLNTTSVSIGPTRLDIIQSWEVVCHDFVQSTIINKQYATLATYTDAEQVTVNNPTDTPVVTTG